MISKLRVKNYILIDDITVDFCEGLNVITGETGSGKSLLLNAIDIAFGAKTSKEIIKTGCDKATIELTLNNKHDLSSLLDEYGIENWGEELIITREVTAQSSRSRVNGSLVNMEFLKILRDIFLDIHSQHQTYSYMQQSKHISLLDSYSKDVYGDLLSEYKTLWTDYQNVLNELNAAKEAKNTTENQIDFLKFQIDEISSALIEDVSEDVNLQNELNILTNSEKLKEYVTGAFWTLSEDDSCSMNSLMKVKNFISKASSYDEKLSDVENSIVEVIDSLKNISYELNSYSSKLEFDENRINEIQERLSLLDKIKRKYGNTLEDVLATYTNLTAEYEKIEASDLLVTQLSDKAETILSELKDKASNLTELRKSEAEKLAKAVIEVLTDLELKKSKFEISVLPAELSSSGSDNIEFLISTNVSEPLKPMIKVASGGEISRIMLAIKTVFAQNDDIDTVIFDEIDTGISGKASIAVADKISDLSKYRQIILITHQAIIASKADNHIYVSKNQGNTTSVNVKLLSDDEKLKALAELASGNVTENSLDFARSLVE